MCIKKGIKMNCIKKIANVCILLLMTTGIAWGMDIFQAAETGNIARVSELLAAVPENSRLALVRQQSDNGDTPLHKAAMNGHEQIVLRLIGAGADVNQQNDWDNATLHLAAMEGHDAVVFRLIEAGARVNQQDFFGMTALHWAAQEGHEQVVLRLIEAGAAINQQDNYGKTAVDLATISNQHTIVALLNDYNQRMEQARQRVPVIAHILARATHPRLGAASPLALLPQELLRHITRLAVQAEEMDARKPRQSSDSRSWCIIS